MAWGPAAIWAAVLFLLSELQTDPSPDWLFVGDKVKHLALYLVLGATLAWGRDRAAGAVPAYLLVLLGLGYGALDEWHQSFVPGRDPSAGDFLADTAGVVLGFFLLHLLLSTRPKGRFHEHP